MATQWPICKIARPGDRGQARSYRDLYWLADLVGAGLPAMASLRSGGATGGLEDREQARSYRGLWWLAVILWELACQRWHHCGLAERPGCQRIASKLAPTGVCGGWRILWELACQRWHHCGLAERPGCQRIASKLAPTGGLWWLAVILWELACQRWHHRCLAERPGG